MARLTFPDEGSRLIFRSGASNAPLKSAAGATCVVYTDAAATTLADLRDSTGSALATASTLTVDAYSRLPIFQGPNDGTDTLYVVVDGGPTTPVYARTDDRIDSLATSVAANTAAITAEATARTTAATAAATLAAGTYQRKHRDNARVSFNPSLLADPAVPVSPVTITLNATPTSPVAVDAATAGPMVTFKGGVCSIVTLSGTDAWRNTQPIYQGASGIQSIYAVEFDIMDNTNALETALRLRDNISSNGCRVWLWVDGVPQSTDYVSLGVTPSGGIFNLHLALGAGSTGRRRVKIYLHNCDFAGFNKKGTSIISPTSSAELKLGVLADSWGAGANTVLPGRTYLRTAARLLGAQVFMEAQGGTGYCTPTANPGFNIYANRLTGLATAPLDYLIIAGSLNDDVNNDQTALQIQTAAAACYAAWYALRPDVPIIVIGVQSVGTAASTGDANADRIINNNAVKAAALAASNVLGYIDMMAEKWMTGDGIVGATTGNGPSDWAMDSAYHPSIAGADILAQRAAARISDILKAA